MSHEGGNALLYYSYMLVLVLHVCIHKLKLINLINNLTRPVQLPHLYNCMEYSN